MSIANYINLDLDAKTDATICGKDVKVVNAIANKSLEETYPILKPLPKRERRRLELKVEGSDSTFFTVSASDDKETIFKIFDPETKQQLGQISTMVPSVPIRTVLDSEVTKQLCSLYPWLAKVAFDNLMIAGGSLTTIIQKLSMNEPIHCEDINDVDFFLYGDVGMPKVESLLTQIKTQYPDSTFIRTPYSATLVDKKGINKFQIIMSLFDSPSQILHSFDLGSCKVGLIKDQDGFKLITTELGLFCLERRINIFDHRYDSNTYHKRLVKYFNRGYAIVYRDLDMKMVTDSYKKNGYVKLQYFTLNLIKITNHQMIGALTVNQRKNVISNLVKSAHHPECDNKQCFERSSYDAGLNFKNIHHTDFFDIKQQVSRFMSGAPLFATKVDPDHFKTGEEAFKLSTIVPDVQPNDFRPYIPSIYVDDKLNLKVIETIKEFNYNDFMACRRKGPAYLESYLFAIYYGEKSIEHMKAFKSAHAKASSVTLEKYHNGSFF